MKILRYTYLLPLLALMLLTACCEEIITDPEDIQGPGMGDVTFRISGTRGTLMPAEDDGELISSYLIVVAQGGQVVKVLSATGLPAAEMHAVKASIAAGTYKVYAFANIPFSTEGDWLYGKFTEGAAMPDLSTWYYGGESFTNGMTGPIPMSGSRDGQDLTVLADKGTTTYGIEVVRMMAKVEFVFMNSSSEAVTVSQITMGPLTTKGTTTDGFIPLSWYDDAAALSFYAVDDKKYGTGTYTHTIRNGAGVASPITLAANDVTKKPTTSFYVIESNPDPVSKQFNLSFTVTYGGKTEQRFAQLDKTLVATGTNLDGDDDRSPFIRRNDWIRIPIDLGDYELRLEARSYPPIGGYPEAEVTGESEFNVNFRYKGEFSIRPSLRKYGTTDWIYLDDKSVVESYDLTVDTTSDGLTDIFKKKPTKKGSEIIGTIKSGVKGTALVTLTVHIDDGTGIKRTLTRKLYITI